MPAAAANISTIRWPEVPSPVVPTFTLPGFAFAYAITSAIVFGGNFSDASSANGTFATSATGANWSILYVRFGISTGLSDMVVAVAISSVCPSAGARSRSWTPSCVCAPALFSTTHVWPNFARKASAMRRASTSVVPPAG